MSKRANSHRNRQPGWAVRRFAALAFTLAGIAAGSILAPSMRAPRPARLPPVVAQTNVEPASPDPILDEIDVALDLPAQREATPPRRRARSGIPLNATASAVHEGYEILSATELDGISQARN